MRVVWKPVLTDAGAIRRAMGEANEDPPASASSPGCTPSPRRRCGSPGLDALRKPLLHLHTQADAALPWATIDMDFMNLNQAAHGDREYGFMLTRLRVPRTTVVGHVSNPAVRARIGSWARAAAGAAAARGLKLARFGDNMRNVAVTEGDKVEAEIRFGVSVNTWGVNDLVAVVDAVADVGRRRAGRRVRRPLRDVAPSALPAARSTSAVRYQAPDRGRRCASFLVDGGFGAFTTNFEDLGGLRQLPGLAVQRLMADGYGFGGEGDWKTSALLRVAQGRRCRAARRHLVHGGLHLRPGARATSGSSARTCSRSARRSPARSRGSRCTRSASAAARTRPGWSSPPPRARRRRRLVATCGDRFRWVANEIDVVEPSEPLPNLPVARAVWQPRPTSPRRPRAG